ncbi:uncharacterized protein K452DRAFT_353155 [Aplosporella prunicola CBS 121167]|uniref:UDP-glucose/GDP-mannose dehydrogenase C-terminal domain-containing protein n=1 Tax=Aplosporella prunicola CBS 121167 TaxID=1176127 RepID=A0A6A6B274_9PEZI|nr:uncharacterized protein K452DRAFT_353155 [Aplosporella prunicola CBS 121167]KAF2138289.1 hypothetical protein K452DRAFT_353155 [Aplosporella prunicola CBS 121167]
MPYTKRRKNPQEASSNVRRAARGEKLVEVDISDPCICVVGVGFVGEALLREFGHKFRSIGFDISNDRIEELRSLLKGYTNITLTTNKDALASATHYLISVPTLLKEDRSVDLSHLLSAITMVLSYARPGCVIVIESSVSVGTTRQIFGPYQGIFHCGMSPERVDPGRIIPTAKEVPKIVSGLTTKSLAAIKNIYAQAFDHIVPVSKPEVAEMTKLFENCYRMVNVAYVNEMADAARSHGVDPTEMIQAASSKPYGFTPFQPGLGVGGHCIPINPFYLFANNKHLPVLEKATAKMWQRPVKVARSVHRRITTMTKGKPPRILVVGMGFKPGQSVLSCSPGLAFAEKLRDLGCARLTFYDPLVPQDHIRWMEKLKEEDWNQQIIDEQFDAVAICVRQTGVNFKVTEMLQRAKVHAFQ